MLFLDACAIIYRVETVEPWNTRLRAAVERLRRADITVGVAISELSWLECRVQPLRDNKTALLAAYDHFFSTAHLTVVPLTRSVIDLATAVRARSKLRTPDALQAACCLSLGPSAHFLTSDPAFKREPALDVVLI